jgi:hypothetical protein
MNDHRCQQARSTIFIFLFDLLDMDEAAQRCFGSSAFVTCFVPCICQPSLNASVKAALSRFLRNCTPAEHVIPCVELLCAIVGCCYKEEVIIDVIHTINIAADVNQNICKYLSQLVPYMTSFLERSPTKERLRNVMQFYIRMAVEFDRKDLERLTALVKEIDGEMIGEDTAQAFLAGAILNAVPGIILQLLLIPAIMSSLHHTGLQRFCGYSGREEKA